MRPLEALLVAALIVALALRWLRPRNRQVTATLLAMIGILAALHLVFDGWRWEMIPAYAMAVGAAWILSRDLRRVSGAKAGESARWAAIPSTSQRVGWGVILGVTAATALMIPAWAFPRIVLPEPDGLYYVGRLDITWTDSARNNRPIDVAVWYPAEQPNGRVISYHPQPGRLGAQLARGSSLPGFTFRNLTAARTHATLNPRFSIREGRSPIVLVAHDSGGSRFEGTALHERLASQGYVVASVGDDGSGELGAGTADMTQRVGDLVFVLDRLVNLPAGGAIDTLNGHVRVDRIVMIGRGAGAAVAMELAATEPRVTAVVAVNPAEFGEAALRGVRRPLLVFTVSESIPGLDDASRYGGTEARLEGATGETLSDRALLGRPITRMLGIESVDTPQDVHAAVSALTLRFLDQYLKERREETQVDLPSRVRVRIIPHQPRAG
jgi:predicted dienelactone hydrolase